MIATDLAQLFAGASDGGIHSAAVQTALIGGSFALLGVLLSFLLDRGGRKSPPGAPPQQQPPGPPTDPANDPERDDDLETELRKRAERAEEALTNEQRRCQAYRDMLLTNRINPDTGQRITAHRREVGNA